MAVGRIPERERAKLAAGLDRLAAQRQRDRAAGLPPAPARPKRKAKPPKPRRHRRVEARRRWERSMHEILLDLRYAIPRDEAKPVDWARVERLEREMDAAAGFRP